ncbi:MAG: hypothetical protein KDD33_04965 [Bdellovibrionales bacterium]|nr:hypothetical protein [Bdellovibrionales bacterium]
MKISSQLILAVVLIFGLSFPAQAKNKSTQYKPTYKVENCDCLGFSDDIPTFLSDLPNAQGVEIFGEGKDPKEANERAQNMCVETYRNFASTGYFEDHKSVTRTGCKMYKSTPDGDWVSI